jgi:hypothetical protein
MKSTENGQNDHNLQGEIAKSQKNINQQYKCTALARNIIQNT